MYMDANGDTQGNYTLIGRQPIAEDFHHEQGLYPVGVFHIPQNHSTIPVSAISIFHFWIEKKKKCLGHGIQNPPYKPVVITLMLLSPSPFPCTSECPIYFFYCNRLINESNGVCSAAAQTDAGNALLVKEAKLKSIIIRRMEAAASVSSY